MDIFCSRGQCEPCRSSISIKHKEMEHFCFRHFIHFYKERGYSPIFYKEKMYDELFQFARDFTDEHNVSTDIQNLVVNDIETEDIVGECCGEVV